MKGLIDANVLFPTVQREMILGAAEAGFFEPLWSRRLLEEWARAAARLGPDAEAQARGAIALLGAKWPKAEIAAQPGLEARLWLPDPADVHVLAVAIAGSADVIITQNAKDFPRHILAEEGVSRVDPDGFLHGFWHARPEVMQAVGDQVLAQARALSDEAWEMRPLLKKARLPRLAKALSG